MAAECRDAGKKLEKELVIEKVKWDKESDKNLASLKFSVSRCYK